MQTISLSLKGIQVFKDEIAVIPLLCQEVPPGLLGDCIASDETVIDFDKSFDLMLIKLFKQFAARTKKIG